ncbi:MAG TPA: D-arabinono-1,4-lactone oxidase [Rhizomicrobium sp.]
MKIVGGKWSNWSGGVTCKPKEFAAPKDDVELAAAIRKCPAPVRVPGTGHSFTPLNATSGTIIDLKAFDGLHGFDHERNVATFGGATPVWEIGPLLHPAGFALKNMGDIDRQTLGGVVGTGTHGTGNTLGSFSAEVAGFRLVLADGSLIDCSPSENTEIFEGGRCAMGMFGVMTEIAISVRPVYKLTEKEFLLPIDELFEQLDHLIASNRHFEFFWFPYADVAICKTLNETNERAPEPRDAETMFKRGEMSGPQAQVFSMINEVLPYAPFLLRSAHRFFSRMMPAAPKVRWSHEMFPNPRPVRFNEMEYAVPVEKGPGCVREIVAAIRKNKINTGFPIEYRTVAPDDVWMSPFYKRPSATIALHQYHRVDTTKLFEMAEGILRRYEGRPHWGKRHTRSGAELAQIYPEYERFVALRRKLDPTGKFLNPYLAKMFE